MGFVVTLMAFTLCAMGAYSFQDECFDHNRSTLPTTLHSSGIFILMGNGL
jgi:hypothetical protein